MATDFYMTHLDSLHHGLASTHRSDRRVGVWVGRDPVSAHLVQRHRERCLVIPQHDRCFGHVQTYEVVVWVLRRSVNIDVSRQQGTVQSVDGGDTGSNEL